MNDITVGTNIEATNFPFLLAAGASVLMGIYSFTLPSTPPKSKGQSVDWKQLIGLDALSLLRDRSFLVLFLASLLICIPLSFYYGFTNPYLNEIGFADAAGKMTFGQMSEMLFLFIMPFFFKRLGVKNMMLIGMGAWVLRYILFAYGNADDMVWMLYLGIILHGICYDFFFVTGQIYADDRAPEHLKSSVQGLMTFATYGVGMFIGTWASGKVVDLYTIGEQAHNWTQIWMIPAVFAVGVLVLFGLFFKNPKQG
ncbi:UNVERIFIED_CONTAM: hypothetical protein GTU68_058646 [Idotea baltica]|nr:hypothetical protein [Idotea baltica]